MRRLDKDELRDAILVWGLCIGIPLVIIGGVLYLMLMQ